MGAVLPPGKGARHRRRLFTKSRMPILPLHRWPLKLHMVAILNPELLSGHPSPLMVVNPDSPASAGQSRPDMAASPELLWNLLWEFLWL
jgi:hypothetical protein